MEFGTGLMVGLGIAFVIWRLELKKQCVVDTAFDYYLDLHAACNKGDTQETDKARTRYVQYFDYHNLQAVAFRDRFRARVEQMCYDAGRIGNKPASVDL